MPFHTGLVHRASLVLVLIDVQERLAAVMERRDDVVATVVRLVRFAELIGAPIVVTRQYPDGLGDTVPGIAHALEQAARTVSVTVVDKMSFCACDEPAFLEALYETSRSQVVVAGMETHICVTQTALTLAKKTYPVQVVADACCSRRGADHLTALDRLRTAGVVVTTAESVMYEAVSRAGTEEFKRLLAIVKEG
ncbi:MAG: isochorismatase family protein [Coriobacteriia bacterium]|jgi:nicotinamidase-related amidase|nr:isochorismatase family protein [Coriobacteriia bacterium]